MPTGWNYNGEHLDLDTVYVQLSTKNMKPDERASFMKGKRDELKEFFGNGVWEFHHPDGTEDPNRILKAGWVLKWTKWEDGSPRAKARLVLQGFNDPDALDGKVKTSSPTVSRLGRILCLQMATARGWRTWSGDIQTAFLQGLPQE